MAIGNYERYIKLEIFLQRKGIILLGKVFFLKNFDR